MLKGAVAQDALLGNGSGVRECRGNLPYMESEPAFQGDTVKRLDQSDQTHFFSQKEHETDQVYSIKVKRTWYSFKKRVKEHLSMKKSRKDCLLYVVA